MTLSIAWVRTQSTIEELVIATDSRLRAGYAWDTAPKIFTFSRGDCAICFAGNTNYAYPIMEQIRNSIETYEKSKSRALDLFDLQGHLSRVLEEMRKTIHDLRPGQTQHDSLDATFIFAGFSWKVQKFVIWLLTYNTEENKFIVLNLDKIKSNNKKEIKYIKNKINCYEKHINNCQKYLSEILDKNSENYIFYENKINEFQEEIKKEKENLYLCNLNDIIYSNNILLIGDNELEAKQQIVSKIKFNNINNKINYEPFEVLRDFCRDDTKHHIGGSPQIIKIYKHLNTMPYIMFWPNKKSQKRSLFGRPLMNFENPNYMTFDPDKLVAEDFTPTNPCKHDEDYSI